MSRKNHKMVDGKLLQTDKRFNQLKMKQQEKISDWYYQAYRRVFYENRELPTAQQEDGILFEVLEKIRDAEIWIPDYEVENHFAAKRGNLQKRVLRDYGQDIDYDLLLKEAEELLEMERHMIPLLSNLSALLNMHLRHINWVGFYLVTAGGNLALGPFQGKPACIEIAKGKGLCGTALEKCETVCVQNVHAFPGHIACDADSLSEIVVPILGADGVKTVLDINSPVEGRFFERDQQYLEKLSAILTDTVIWELK